MKSLLRIAPVLAFACLLTFAVSAGEKPQAALEAVKELRADRRTAQALEKAKASVKEVDPAKVDLADAQAWYDLFVAAQEYQGAHTIAGRWTANAKGEDKFKAQVALMTMEHRLKDMKSLARTLSETKPVDTAGAIRLATLANGYVLSAFKEADKETAMKVLATGEAFVPKNGFADDKYRDAAKRAGDQLAKTRKLIEENPGKEAEAIETERLAAIRALLGRRPAANSTNAAAARAERDAKFAKFIGQEATDFKPDQVLGDFKGVGALKGKVVILDFFAHWCGPCIASLPDLRKLYDDLKPQGLQVVGVTRFYGYYRTENHAKKDMAPEKEMERMKDFMSEKQINWPVAFVDKDAFAAYGASAIPHVVVIDRQGRIHKIKVGYYKNEAEAFHKEIEKLLGG